VKSFVASAREIWHEQLNLVNVVAAGYHYVCDLQPVVAYKLDHQMNTNKWSPGACHYKCDIEKAVEDVIARVGKSEEEREALNAAWLNILSDDSTIDLVEQRLIRLLGGVFKTRGLHPKEYFRPTTRRDVSAKRVET